MSGDTQVDFGSMSDEQLARAKAASKQRNRDRRKQRRDANRAKADAQAERFRNWVGGLFKGAGKKILPALVTVVVAVTLSVLSSLLVVGNTGSDQGQQVAELQEQLDEAEQTLKEVDDQLEDAQEDAETAERTAADIDQKLEEIRELLVESNAASPAESRAPPGD